MKKINKQELFGNLKNFLKSKGVELQDGPYTKRIQQGCGLLAESINVSQEAMKRAKAAVDKKLNQMRQVIHEKTAPKPPVYPKTGKPGPQPARAATNRTSRVPSVPPRKSSGTRAGKRKARGK